jgi:hypothetical protein
VGGARSERVVARRQAWRSPPRLLRLLFAPIRKALPAYGCRLVADSARIKISMLVLPHNGQTGGISINRQGRMVVVTKEFENYMWFSVQVDQYYAAVRILARHYEPLRAAYNQLPSREEWPQDFSCLADAAQKFFLSAAASLGDLGSTQIFASPHFAQLTNLSEDMFNFGFYTCFSFQWTLFENFTKTSILALVHDALVSPAICSALRSRERRTEKFLQYIDNGHVFGHSPFHTVLPVAGWVPQVENVGYSDLDRIRIIRNDFIHGIKDTAILPISPLDKERLYDRSMLVLRKFAENIDTEVRGIRGP